MICHLNQQAFQKFGTIFSERQADAAAEDRAGSAQVLRLTRAENPLFLSQHPCRVCPGGHMTVLSVSEDGSTFQRFYLDKPVQVRPGIIFCLSPVGESSTAELAAPEAPQVLEYRQVRDELRTLPSFRVESLYTLFYQEKEKGFFFPGEAHPMVELTYVDRGEVHSVADGENLLLKKGDMVLYAPEQWHMQYADMGEAPRYVTVSFQVEGQLPGQLYNRRLVAPREALELLEQMLREQEQGVAYGEDMLLALLTQLLVILCRKLDGAPEKLQAGHAVRSENETIRRAQQYIGAHVRQKLTVPLVASAVEVSPSYLTALFHKHLGIAPGEYIRRIKLQESKQMIRENTMNLTQIAAELQYSTVHHFSRQFKDRFGITPSEYAKSVK